jgi:hypothetical protein
MRNVHVTAYDQASRCNVQSFGTAATVNCYEAATGAPVNSRFSFLALGPGATSAGFGAYAWADDKASAQYTPDPLYAFNAAGGAIAAQRSATGTYTLQFAGLSLATGNVQVTAYNKAGHCNVVSWSNEQVSVKCYDVTGALSDSRYEVLVTQTADTTPEILGYATTEAASDPGGDLTASGYTFNAAGGTTTATRTGLGMFTVRFAGTDLSTGHVQVTAMGSNNYCNVNLFDGDQVSVACYDTSGAAVDSRFSIVAIR